MSHALHRDRVTATHFKTAFALVILVLGLYAALAFSIYNGLTRYVIGANDLYSRWVGARALYLEGKNPYSQTVTQEIQLGMTGRLANEGEDQLAFAYPLYDAFFLLPLVGLPYAQVQAFWMAGLTLAAVAGILLIHRSIRVVMSPGLVAALTFGTLFYYPVTRAIFLGQFALLSFFFLALAFYCMVSQRDAFAGVFLALSTVKPQMAALLVPCIMGWAFWHRRWKLVASTAGALTVLVLGAAIWLPSWPIDFVRGLVAYSDYIHVGPPVETALSILLPARFVGPGLIIVSLGLVAAAVLEWARSSDDITSAFCLTAFVTACAAVRIGSSDQVILLFPWSLWLAGTWRSGRRAVAMLLGIGVIAVPWLVFLSTVRGDAEDPRVTLVLPFVTLVALISFRIAKFNWVPRWEEAR